MRRPVGENRHVTAEQPDRERHPGTAVASSAANWPRNPPFDLADPQFASNEISAEEFEQAWEHATRHQEWPGPNEQADRKHAHAHRAARERLARF
jgi:hypothetical protein